MQDTITKPTAAKGVQLKDAKLFRQQCYIDGAWVDADRKQAIDVTNPANNEVIGTVPKLGAAETRRAIEAAERAFPAWRAKTAKERAVILRRWFDLMMANQDDLAVLMTTEQGKPLAEAKGEVAYAASFIEWFGEEAKRIYGDTIPQHQSDKRIVVIKEPIGVVACITPWNFPAAMITRKAGPAIAAGCTVVIKPATMTPFSALALAELAERAGLPKGVLNVVTGPSGEVGGELTSNPIVRKLSFTGSTEVGKLLIQQCAGTVKKTSMELGGNAPFIVFDDADLDAAVEGAIAVQVSQHRADLRLRQPLPGAGQGLRRLCREAGRRGQEAQGRQRPRIRRDARPADRFEGCREGRSPCEGCGVEGCQGRHRRQAPCIGRHVL